MSETPSSTGVKRRDFLKILGTTTAVAGCNMDEPGKLIPYLVSPDNTVPGVSTYTWARLLQGMCWPSPQGEA